MRKIIQSARFLIDDAQKVFKSVSKIISQYHPILENINRSSQSSKSLHISPYFANNLKNEISGLKDYANRKTGFHNIDLNQFFAPGLYFISATLAAGKTTFCWQLLEPLAKNGKSCILYSYEMSGLELFTKTTARHLFLRDKQSSLTVADIRCGSWSKTLDSIAIEFSTSGADLQILELQDESVDNLINLLRPICDGKVKAPVVCIDYLQIFPHQKDNINSTLTIPFANSKNSNATLTPLSSSYVLSIAPITINRFPLRVSKSPVASNILPMLSGLCNFTL